MIFTNRKISLLSFIFVFLLGLSSCDPAVDYAMIIQNASEYEIIIIPVGTDSVWKNFEGRSDLSMAPKLATVIAKNFGIGKVDEYEDCPFQSDSFEMKISGIDSLKIDVDIYDPTNWTFDVLQNSTFGGGGCECRLIITDEDIK